MTRLQIAEKLGVTRGRVSHIIKRLGIKPKIESRVAEFSPEQVERIIQAALKWRAERIEKVRRSGKKKGV